MSSEMWIDDDAGFVALCKELAGVPAVALDTEFHRERTYFAQVALMQLAWPGRVALVDTLGIDLAPFADVLRSDTTVVMHAAEQDLEILRVRCQALPSRLFDTQTAARFVGYSSPALGTLLERVLGIRLPKGDRLSDWTRRPLTSQQREYAAADVAHLLDLRDALLADLDRRGRRAWAEQECALVLAGAASPPDPEVAWWRIKEARRLRGESRGVAQELAAWRERRAMTIDRPARFVLPDLAVVALAQRPPSTAADLGHVRGVDRGQLRPVADDVLAAVRRGRELGRSDLRLPPDATVDGSLRASVILATAWVAQLARDLELDPALLATRADVEAHLRDDPTGRLATGWRAQLAGEPLRRLLAGDAALAFDASGHLALEERSYRKISPSDGPTVPG